MRRSGLGWKKIIWQRGIALGLGQRGPIVGKRCFDDKNDLTTIFSAMRNGFLRACFPSHGVMRDVQIIKLWVHDREKAHERWLRGPQR